MYSRLLHVTSQACFRFISGGTVGIPESQEVEKTLFTGVSTLLTVEACHPAYYSVFKHYFGLTITS